MLLGGYLDNVLLVGATVSCGNINTLLRLYMSRHWVPLYHHLIVRCLNTLLVLLPFLNISVSSTRTLSPDFKSVLKPFCTPLCISKCITCIRFFGSVTASFDVILPSGECGVLLCWCTVVGSSLDQLVLLLSRNSLESIRLNCLAKLSMMPKAWWSFSWTLSMPALLSPRLSMFWKVLFLVTVIAFERWVAIAHNDD